MRPEKLTEVPTPPTEHQFKQWTNKKGTITVQTEGGRRWMFKRHMFKNYAETGAKKQAFLVHYLMTGELGESQRQADMAHTTVEYAKENDQFFREMYYEIRMYWGYDRQNPFAPALGEQVRDEFLEAYAEGMSAEDAATAAGFNPSSLPTMLKRYPDLAERYTALKAARAVERQNESIRRRARFYALVEAGMTQASAQVAMGVTGENLRQWRHRDPEWAAKLRGHIETRRRDKLPVVDGVMQRMTEAELDAFIEDWRSWDQRPLEERRMAPHIRPKLRTRKEAQASVMEAPKMVTPILKDETATPELKELLGDFPAFRQRFFGHDTPPHQQEMIDAISRARARGGKSITLILCPPEAGKTTLLNEYVANAVAKDFNLRVVIGSEAAETAKKRLMVLGRLMSDTTHPFTTAYGPFYEPGQETRGYPWSSTQLRVMGADPSTVDNTIECHSIGGSIVGARVDLMILDDVSSLANLPKTKGNYRKFIQDWRSRVTMDGAIVIIGTRVDVNDFYSILFEMEVIDELVIIPALTPEGESYWPERYSKDHLERERKVIGEKAWWSNWMHKPTFGSGMTFTDDVISDAWDDSVPYGGIDECPKIISLDPATYGHCAIGVAEIHPHHLTFIDCESTPGLGRTEAILGRLGMMVERYRPMAVIIEKGPMGSHIIRDQRLRDMAEQYGFRIQEHVSTSTKTDGLVGVQAMGSAWVEGKFRLAAGDEYVKRRLQPLIEEAAVWRADIPVPQLRQDVLMTAWFAWKWWRERSAAFIASGEQSWSTTKLPFAPTGVAPEGEPKPQSNRFMPFKG